MSNHSPRWSRAALDDYDRIGDFIADRNPTAALDKLGLIDVSMIIVCDYPLSGKTGRVKNTRERVVDKTNYTIIYDISKGIVRVLRIVHHSQQWPTQSNKKTGMFDFDW